MSPLPGCGCVKVSEIADRAMSVACLIVCEAIDVITVDAGRAFVSDDSCICGRVIRLVKVQRILAKE